MSAPPYMQLYVADYTADTQHLSCEQDGAYWRLLRAMWRAGGSLPNDPRKLAHIVGLSAGKWARISGDVMAFFDVCGDVITQRRMQKELEKFSGLSAKRAASGSAGGRAKALKTNEPDLANATGLLEQKASISEPDSDSERKGEATASLLPDPFNGFWLAYPLKVGKPKARSAYEAAAKRIAKAKGADPPLTIMTGLLRWLPTWTDPKFTPHPTTWLNRDGWDDKPPESHERPDDYHGQTSDPRRANTESRRGAWVDVIAERDGFAAGDRAGPGGAPADDRGEPGNLRLAYSGPA